MHRLPPQSLVSLSLAVVLFGPVSLRAEDTSSEPATLELASLDSGVAVRLQAVSPVDARVVWASGLEGTWVRTDDGGDTWTSGRIAGAEDLQLRDVDAFSAGSAWVLSAGPGEQSRIFRTDDAGESWTTQAVNDEVEGFWDCLGAWDGETAVVYGDSVGGQLRILRTTDAGATWTRLSGEAVPAALDGEGGFAASGTCVATAPDGRGWIATGNGSTARVLRTTDRGATWAAASTPLAAGEAAGGATLVRRSTVEGSELLVLGGVIGDGGGEDPVRVAASSDAGRTWAPRPAPDAPGAIYGAAVDGSGHLLAVGPLGIHASSDGAESWTRLAETEIWSVAFAGESGWLVGPEGRILRVSSAR